MAENIFFVLAGCALVWLGAWLRKNPEKVYRCYTTVLGAGAFPAEGVKYERGRLFFRQFGWLVQTIGFAGILAAAYSIIVQ